MQPLTLPEQRELEKLLSELKAGHAALICNNPEMKNELDSISIDLAIKALTIALQANTALSEAWRKDWKPLSYDERFNIGSNLTDFRK